jgi:hypothetical protein
MNVTLSMTGEQHARLQEHLFPPDGKEAAAIMLCGRRAGTDRHRLLVKNVHLVPHESCTVRSPLSIAWPTDLMVPWLEQANRSGLSVVKIHSHRGDYARFSNQDDQSDADLFPCIDGWIESSVPHASVIMLSDGRIFGRTIDAAKKFTPISTVAVVGDDLHLWRPDDFAEGRAKESLPLFTQRHAQAFGESTTRRLRGLSAGVVGCSGTGSIVIEQLMRLGIGRLVLIDDDVVKDVNLNRILNATANDAEHRRKKVNVSADAIIRTGLGTVVEKYATNLYNPDAVRAIAGCDVLFGCVDTAEGRFLSNLLATFYLLPYIDVGVVLEADDQGSITQVCGYVHYLQPGQSSLLSREAISMEDVRAEGIKRQNPKYYEDLKNAGYIRNVQEERPAVISVNTTLAGMAVNELLARLHGFRDEPNRNYATIGISISQVLFYLEPESGLPCKAMHPHVGRGDVVPLLQQAELSE